MLTSNELKVVDYVERYGSFTAAANAMYKVPSAVSYTIRQLEERLAVQLFTREKGEVKLTPAGSYFASEARRLLEQMEQLKSQTQRVSNGWTDKLSLAYDGVVRRDLIHQLIADFDSAFPDVELHLSMEVFNGVWDALADGRADVVLGATSAIPVGGTLGCRDMGQLKWTFAVPPNHPLLKVEGSLTDDAIRNYPALYMQDTSLHLPKRNNWQIDNQRRIMVPDWSGVISCLLNGVGIAMVPRHKITHLLDESALIARPLDSPFPDGPCCLAWNKQPDNPALNWLLEYLGEGSALHRWIS